MRCLLPLLVLALGAGCGGGAAPPDAPLASAPLLTAVVPAEGPLGGGIRVQIEGQGFDALDPTRGVYVGFGGAAARGEVQSDTVVLAWLPCGTALGPQDVTLEGGSHHAQLASAFTFVPDPPTLAAAPSAVAPHGTARAPTRVVLTGAAFTAAARVELGHANETAGALLEQTAEALVVALELDAEDVGRVIPIRVLDEGLDAVVTVRVVAPAAPGDVFVSEVHAQPDSDQNGDGFASPAGDEFVELVNARATPLDLTGATLSDATGLRHVVPNPTVVPGGGVLVIFGSGTPLGFAPRHASGAAQAATGGSLGLNNTSDELALLAADGTELFRLGYASSTAGRSLQALDMETGPPSPATGADYGDAAPTPGRR